MPYGIMYKGPKMAEAELLDDVYDTKREADYRIQRIIDAQEGKSYHNPGESFNWGRARVMFMSAPAGASVTHEAWRVYLP